MGFVEGTGLEEGNWEGKMVHSELPSGWNCLPFLELFWLLTLLFEQIFLIFPNELYN